MENIISEFMAKKTFAVAGSFRDESKIAYRVLKHLLSRGYSVYPVNPGTKEVEGLKCYPSVLDIPARVDAADLVTPPSVTEQIVRQCLEKGIKYVWMQPGAESEKAIEFCKSNNIKVIYNACLLMGGK